MRIKELTKQFDGKTIFEKVNFEVKKGNVYAIFGKNGVGKTTLLNLLNGNLLASSGKILDRPAHTIFIEDNEIPFPFMNADEFIQVTMAFKNKKVEEEEKARLYKILGLTDRTKFIQDYSKGMKSKLLFMIALLDQPDLLLIDEPFSDLDMYSFQQLIFLLKEQREMTVIFSTHIGKIAHQLSDEILLLTSQGVSTFSNRFESSEELEEQLYAKLAPGEERE